MRTIDEEIARHLQEAAQAGELKAAPSFGKPFAEDVGWNETPQALRMPFKILKDAGVPSPEIELFHGSRYSVQRFLIGDHASVGCSSAVMRQPEQP